MFIPFWYVHTKQYEFYREEILVHILVEWRFKNYSSEGIHQIMCTTEQ